LPNSRITAPPFLARRDGRLELDGVSLQELIARHGTPFFLLSERRLLDNFRALEEGLRGAGGAVALRYCAKANHEAGVLATLAREGSSLLASHIAEVELGLACGFPAASIAFQRPIVTNEELEAVLAAGVTHVHVFRPQDLVRLQDLAGRRDRDAPPLRLSLRLREEGGNWLSGSPLATLNARLGLSIAEARQAALACRDDGRLRISALNVYVGTQQRTARGFDRALAHACSLARDLADTAVATIDEINVGGGVPSSSLARLRPGNLWRRLRDRTVEARDTGGDAPDQLRAFATSLAERFRHAVAAAGLRHTPTLAVEPGRSIVGNAVVLVARVRAHEGRWLFLDASRNFLGESPVLFRRTILPVTSPTNSPVAPGRFFHLSGDTLNTTDVLDLRRRLPPPSVGDALAFCDAGAYSISRASRYAGVSPAVLMVGIDGTVRRIRRPEGADDLYGPMAPALAALRASDPRGRHRDGTG
jgi:diaminopimelate decarboxylase